MSSSPPSPRADEGSFSPDSLEEGRSALESADSTRPVALFNSLRPENANLSSEKRIEARRDAARVNIASRHGDTDFDANRHPSTTNGQRWVEGDAMVDEDANEEDDGGMMYSSTLMRSWTKRRAEQLDAMAYGERQVAESREVLDQLQREAEDGITRIRIDGDAEEHDRRQFEENAHGIRLKKLREEGSTSDKRNAFVSMRWEALREISEPQDLHRQLDEQREACQLIVASKNRLVDEFKDQLKKKDEEYVRSLRKQADDIDKLIEIMREQTRRLQSAYDSELIEIESSFDQQRKELIEKHAEELENLWKKRRDLEESALNDRQKKIMDNQNLLDGKRRKDAEDYHALRMMLMKNIHGLEQELEEMRAKYQLNLEKLRYNYQVLNERVTENNETITHYKRRISRLQDLLSKFMAKYASSDKKYKKENQELSDQYNRLTELQRKFRHFEEADAIKYQEVWDMNYNLVQSERKRILDSDRIIHEQQLGIEWMAPEDSWTSMLDGLQQGNGESSLDQDEPDHELNVNQSTGPNPRLLAKVLDLVYDELNFLVDSKVEASCASLSVDEAKLLKVNNILESIGVNGDMDLNEMIPYFLDQESGDFDSDAWISHEVVVKAVREFIEDQHKKKARELSRSSLAASSEERQKAVERVHEREFWERATHVLPPDRERLWDILEQGLSKYNQILQERVDLMEETEALRDQNEELRNLLNQYLSANINDELMIPPAEAIGAQIGQLYRS